MNTTMDLGLSGRVAVVTGATRGIGRGIALALATAGVDVFAVARTSADLVALGDHVRPTGRRFGSYACDLTDDNAPDAAIAEATELLGSPSILVNAAGVMNRREPPDITAADIADLFELNLGASLLMCQAAAPALSANPGGSIVNITSIAATEVTRASTLYSASKAAVLQMTRVLAVRLAPDIRVNSVAPGYIETDMNRVWLSNPANREYVLASTALKRLGTVEDIANAVVFLSSQAAAHITGQHLIVDGGWYPG